VLIDPHNYARYNGNLIGSAAVPHAAFADFWSRVAQQFVGNPRVLFGLMNEPHDMPTEQWLAAANAAIAAIRAAGASNLSSCPQCLDRCAQLERQLVRHAQRDRDARRRRSRPQLRVRAQPVSRRRPSGTSAQVVSTTIGSQRLANFTAWLRSNAIAIPGRVSQWRAQRSGAGSATRRSATCSSTWTTTPTSGSLSWWAAALWGEYMFTLEPQNLGQASEVDRPQLAVMQPHMLPSLRGRCRSASPRSHCSAEPAVPADR
jgi:endoglucanase